MSHQNHFIKFILIKSTQTSSLFLLNSKKSLELQFQDKKHLPFKHKKVWNSDRNTPHLFLILKFILEFQIFKSLKSSSFQHFSVIWVSYRNKRLCSLLKIFPMQIHHTIFCSYIVHVSSGSNHSRTFF